jgi:phenylalanine-4-hydroxylase
MKKEWNDFNNPQVAGLPDHLKKYIVEQNYEKYTPIDHAVWRYVMRQNFSYLKDAAYYPYIPGLKKAGLTIEKIPSLQEINDALAEIGWGAVTVDGFIPPAAFMEYQAYRVLVIAADIRQLEHIEYTAAPDIIHEAAGHAPIISDPDYNQYLSYLGSLCTKAIFSARDHELYEAIRQLSILKETPNISRQLVEEAESRVLDIQDDMGDPSEMALLSRLQWWTVEYGLIGDLVNFKIYGAGLLSSIGESTSCMRPSVKKIPYTIDAVNYAYDITKPQPLLFVTPTFQRLIDVLQEFENGMGFRVGGLESVRKAIGSKNICTAEFSSGVQLTGVFSEVYSDKDGRITYIRTNGPSSLSYKNRELNGHGKDYHFHGFGSPVGKLSGSVIMAHEMQPDSTKEVCLLFESGISVTGKLTNTVRMDDNLLIMSFIDCTVKDIDEKVLFDPSWGVFDMAMGEEIVSVFNGAADKSAFEDALYLSGKTTYHPLFTDEELRYQDLFRQVRKIRESDKDLKELEPIWRKIVSDHLNDWLCSLEILEIIGKNEDHTHFANEIREHLMEQKSRFPHYSKLINDGIRIIDSGLIFA